MGALKFRIRRRLLGSSVYTRRSRGTTPSKARPNECTPLAQTDRPCAHRRGFVVVRLVERARRSDRSRRISTKPGQTQISRGSQVSARTPKGVPQRFSSGTTLNMAVGTHLFDRRISQFIGRNFPQPARSWDFCQVWAIWASLRAVLTNVSSSRPCPGRIRPISSDIHHIRTISANYVRRPILGDLDQFVASPASFGRFRTISVRVCSLFPEFCQFWAISTNLGSIRRNSVLFRHDLV